MKLLLEMSPTIVLVVYAQLVTKWRIGVLATLVQESPDRLARLFVYVRDPFIITSYFAALAGSVAWVFVVEKHDVAIAFPAYVGLTVLLMAICGSMMFGERVGIERMLGIVFIIIGVALVSRT